MNEIKGKIKFTPPFLIYFNKDKDLPVRTVEYIVFQ